MATQAKIDYYNSLPRKRSAVGVLIFQEDRILVLEPSYKPNWVIPGGVVEKSESPLEAALRECHEEIGIHVEITDFLCADYKRGNAETGDAVHFLFLGKIKSAADIEIDAKEISSFHWLQPEEALKKFDGHLATRVTCGLAAIDKGRPSYCEEGQIFF